MPIWNDGSLRMVARAVLVVLLLTFCTPFTLFSEGRQYVTQSHDESSHHYIVPLPGDEASASVPVLLRRTVVFRVGEAGFPVPPAHPVFSLDHPPE